MPPGASIPSTSSVVTRAMAAELDGAPGVTIDLVNGEGSAPRVLRLTFDPARGRHDASAVVKSLWSGVPAIAVDRAGDAAIIINPVTLREEDDGVVASRL